jgi:hypothetical protein
LAIGELSNVGFIADVLRWTNTEPSVLSRCTCEDLYLGPQSTFTFPSQYVQVVNAALTTPIWKKNPGQDMD